MDSYTQKKQTLRQKKEAIRSVLVSTSFRVGLGICVVIFGFMYVLQTNTVSAKGYQMTDLERQIRILEKETRRLDVEIAQHTSISNLESRLAQTNLVVATDVKYMTLAGTAVAKR